MILGFFADLDRWAYENGVELDFSRPGKPTHNAIIKSFNRSFGDECLNVHWFYLSGLIVFSSPPSSSLRDAYA